MNLNIEIYKDSDAEKFDEFILNNSKNGTLFHLHKFISYHPKTRFNSFHLIFKKGKNIIAVLPGAKVETEDSKKFISFPGSSAGGIVFEKFATTRYQIEILKTLILFLKSENFNYLELRLGESIFNFPDNSDIEYLLWHHDFSLKCKELSTCLPLFETEDYWKAYSKLRYKKHIETPLIEGFEIQNTEDISESYKIIEKNLEERFGKKPTHTLKELIELKTRFPDKIDFWCAKKDQIVHATVVVFRLNSRIAHSFYIAQDYSLNSDVLPLVFWNCFKFYKNLGYTWFNFGISSRDKWIKWGIHEFKEKMGGRSMERNTWVLDNLQNYEIVSSDKID
jgi:hypothetical protein